MPKVIKGFAEETSTISYPEALEEASRCYLCYDAPCSKASPTGTDIAGFIARMRSRNFRGALRLVKERNFFPGICSRVCPYDEQCEAVCLRAKYGGVIHIAQLERILADYDLNSKNPFLPDITEDTGKTVAIVGSGPTGLAAAVELIKNGCKVIIYESSRIPGGMLTKGVPSYLIDDKVIEHEIGQVLQLGVDLVTGITVGDNINLVSLKRSYNALLLTIGMGRARRLTVPGAEQGDIFTGMDILESLKLKEKRLRVGEKILVVGGGNVSLDVASSLRKLDIEQVTLIYRRAREHMPAYRNRYLTCEESGVDIRFQTVLKEIRSSKQGSISEAVCQRTELKADGEGKVTAEEVPGSEFVLPADTIIFSVGQELDPILPEAFKLEVTDEGRIKVNRETGQTNDPFIFAAGSCVERTSTVIDAVAKGQDAARKILRVLLGKE